MDDLTIIDFIEEHQEKNSELLNWLISKSLQTCFSHIYLRENDNNMPWQRYKVKPMLEEDNEAYTIIVFEPLEKEQGNIPQDLLELLENTPEGKFNYYPTKV